MDPEQRITLAVTGAADRLLRRLQKDDRVSHAVTAYPPEAGAVRPVVAARR